MNIKVCGITQLKQLQQLDGMEIDFAGLNFYKGSPRYVVGKISGEDIRTADFDIKKVGVFVNESFEKIMEIVEEYQLDIVQLHGDEPPSLCEELSDETEVIKTFRISGNELMVDKMVKPYDEVCDYYLFDKGGIKESLGGTGQQFDWEVLSNSRIEKPFFLGGGVGPEDAIRLKHLAHPDLFAVDINSKFEISPGVKDLGKILGFMREVRGRG
jgi:phosphoribosylanthranilate isomerase